MKIIDARHEEGGQEWTCPDRMVASMVVDKGCLEIDCPDCKSEAGEECVREKSRDVQ